MYKSISHIEIVMENGEIYKIPAECIESCTVKKIEKQLSIYWTNLLSECNTANYIHFIFTNLDKIQIQTGYYNLDTDGDYNSNLFQHRILKYNDIAQVHFYYKKNWFFKLLKLIKNKISKNYNKSDYWYHAPWDNDNYGDENNKWQEVKVELDRVEIKIERKE